MSLKQIMQEPTTNSVDGKTSGEVLLSGGLWGLLYERPARLVFLFLGGLLFRCHEVYSSVNRFLFSQGSRQGTLMPGLLNLWYEQLAYHKILPPVCDLSMKILHSLPNWATTCS